MTMVMMVQADPEGGGGGVGGGSKLPWILCVPPRVLNPDPI